MEDRCAHGPTPREFDECQAATWAPTCWALQPAVARSGLKVAVPARPQALALEAVASPVQAQVLALVAVASPVQAQVPALVAVASLDQAQEAVASPVQAQVLALAAVASPVQALALALVAVASPAQAQALALEAAASPVQAQASLMPPGVVLMLRLGTQRTGRRQSSSESVQTTLRVALGLEPMQENRALDQTTQWQHQAGCHHRHAA